MSQCSWCHDPSVTHVNIDTRKGRIHLVPVCGAHAAAREADQNRIAEQREAKKQAAKRAKRR